MVIQARTIVCAAAAFALVGAVLWGSALMMAPPKQVGHIEISAAEEHGWTVDVQELDSATAQARTAATR